MTRACERTSHANSCMPSAARTVITWFAAETPPNRDTNRYTNTHGPTGNLDNRLAVGTTPCCSGGAYCSKIVTTKHNRCRQQCTNTKAATPSCHQQLLV